MTTSGPTGPDDPGIPFKRHGEWGTLFVPKTKLTRDEMIFYSEVAQRVATQGKDGLDREQAIALIQAIAKEKGYSQAMCDKLIAFTDELDLRGTPSQGTA